MTINYGFPQPGDSENYLDVLLTSQANLDASGGVKIGAGSMDFSDAGVLLSSTSGILWETLTAAQKAQLVIGGTLTCWVESGWIEETNTPTGNQYAFGGYSGSGSTYWSIYRGNSGATLSARVGSGFVGGSRCNSVGKGTHTRIDICHSGGRIIQYVDNFPVGYADAVPGSNYFDDLLIGGITSAPVSPVGYRILRVMVSPKVINIPVDYKLVSMAYFGNSISDNGDYASTNTYIVGDKGNGATGDARALPTLHRMLNKRNRGIGRNKIRNYGVGGETIVGGAGDQGAQLVLALADCSTIKVAICLWGTNEVISSANSWASTHGAGGSSFDFATSYQTEIDSLTAAGAEIILLCTVITPVNHPTYAAQSYQDRTDNCNADIAALVAANSNCYLSDLFTAFGGHSASSTLFNAGDLHPNDTGDNLIGKMLGTTLLGII